MSKYYNLTLRNTSGVSIPMRFDIPLNIPFLQKPSDYDVSVIRFKLPNFTTPIMAYSSHPGDLHNMEMRYNGNTVSHHVDMINWSSNPASTNIWTVSNIILMLNTTIGQLYTALNAIATLPTSDMPYFTYDTTTKLIALTANKNYFASSLTTPIILSIDTALLTWLYGLPTYKNFATEMLDFVIFDLKNNTYDTNYYRMIQEAPTFDNMATFDRVVLTCNLPIANEYVGESTALPIIQDYVPGDLDISTYFNSIVYNAIVPYRQTRLLSDTPFYSVKFDCYTVDSREIYTIMELPPNGTANIKLMFCLHDRNKYA